MPDYRQRSPEELMALIQQLQMGPPPPERFANQVGGLSTLNRQLVAPSVPIAPAPVVPQQMYGMRAPLGGIAPRVEPEVPPSMPVEEPQAQPEVDRRALIRALGEPMAAEPEANLRAAKARFPSEDIGNADLEADLARGEDRQRERMRWILSGLRNIAEGAGNVHVPVAGDFYAGGIIKPEPFVAEDIRAREARLEDELTSPERELYGRFGIDIPEGVRRSQMGGLMRSYGRFGITPYQAARLAQDAEREAGIAERFQQGEERRGRAGERADIKLRRVPDTDRRTLDQTGFVIKRVEKIKADYPEISSSLGPISGRWQMLARKIGLANPEAASTIADLSFQMSQFIYLMTGKQMNEQEMKRLERVLPQAWDSPGQFNAVIDTFIEIMRDKQRSTLEGLEKAGYEVGPWKESGDERAPDRVKTSRRVRVRDPEGRVGTVSEAASKRLGPGWQILSPQ